LKEVVKSRIETFGAQDEFRVKLLEADD